MEFGTGYGSGEKDETRKFIDKELWTDNDFALANYTRKNGSTLANAVIDFIEENDRGNPGKFSKDFYVDTVSNYPQEDSYSSFVDYEELDCGATVPEGIVKVSVDGDEDPDGWTKAYANITIYKSFATG